jgi:hypothetical protein
MSITKKNNRNRQFNGFLIQCGLFLKKEEYYVNHLCKRTHKTELSDIG